MNKRRNRGNKLKSNDPMISQLASMFDRDYVVHLRGLLTSCATNREEESVLFKFFESVDTLRPIPPEHASVFARAEAAGFELLGNDLEGYRLIEPHYERVMRSRCQSAIKN